MIPGKTYIFRIQAETRIGYGPEAVWKEKMPILGMYRYFFQFIYEWSLSIFSLICKILSHSHWNGQVAAKTAEPFPYKIKPIAVNQNKIEMTHWWERMLLVIRNKIQLVFYFYSICLSFCWHFEWVPYNFYHPKI